MSPVLEPEPEKDQSDSVATTFRAPRSLIEEIDAAAGALGLSRNKAINQLLRFALDQHRKERKKKK